MAQNGIEAVTFLFYGGSSFKEGEEEALVRLAYEAAQRLNADPREILIRLVFPIHANN